MQITVTEMEDVYGICVSVVYTPSDHFHKVFKFTHAYRKLKPRPETHMDMILSEVFLKSNDLIPQQQILQRYYLYYR